VGYGSFRFITEFFRSPDSHIGFVLLDAFSMGQLLSLPMIVAGVLLILWARRRNLAAMT
jgi:phosphatidylglycerol:prolipoprotein diacylglycerol transferase